MSWTYPADRYYYGWCDEPPVVTTDRDIKAELVDRLKNVVILTGEVSSSRAKRAAGDDAWDTRGVVDVSNQLFVRTALSS